MHTGDYPMYNRRHFLRHMAGMSVMALPGLHFVEGLRAQAPLLKKENKSLIVLWMSGGPSHMDTWDLKPGAPTGGEFKPIATSASGVEISEHLPTVAKNMQHLSIIRSLVTNEGSHERGRVLLHTARQPNPATQFPSIGSITTHLLTSKDLAIPGFISIGNPADGPGFLGMNYAPFTVQNPGQPPTNIRTPNEVDDLRIRRRQQLFYEVEENFQTSLAPHLGTASRNEEKFKARGDASQAHKDIYGKAFSLVAAKDKKVFDLSSESKTLLDAYGNNNFGRGCLLARRLVEAGVSCVEVDLGGWDNHGNIFPTLKDQRLPTLDKGMGTLVKDLADRGMMQNTVVVWMGEFGRTPRINQNAGRDHWARCWSVVVGGGALKGGTVYGSTNQDGTEVKDDPCSVGDLFATIFRGLGLDPTRQIRDTIGRPFNIAEGKAIQPLIA